MEWAIRVVTECGTRAASLELREGMALATFRSRKAMPKCETKKTLNKVSQIFVFTLRICSILLLNTVIGLLYLSSSDEALC